MKAERGGAEEERKVGTGLGCGSGRKDGDPKGLFFTPQLGKEDKSRGSIRAKGKKHRVAAGKRRSRRQAIPPPGNAVNRL